ncbi:Sugar kinase of the NBD/HSP70 family, may contain an N-terminal HTH domain [Saccharicrinis carchari]|uniref:Sugar kinase of the NBD/HSP70 family, may contain an N-terminal HTH domain n=1 Tax=Saccharicrinis carchari TaxID=1168039 RepID=A0A521F6E5_SACCC|nr:ROK family protein [Saccharicrinis carchari]SMO91752.1 Sugar kinase of the NBD/HSP70 family, may contain an N-terminal HTH domain [Saccharicrinis carchari]
MIIDYLFKKEQFNSQSRKKKQKINIIRFISKSDTACIIPEISKHLKISIPTVNKLILELIDEGIILELGKKETESGRKPSLFSINKKVFYSIGVNIQLKSLRIALVDLEMSIIEFKIYEDFRLENTKECLDDIILKIKAFFASYQIDVKSVLGVGIGLTGRINTKMGESLSYFNFTNQPLATLLSKKLQLPILLENDTRATGLAEEVCGVVGSSQDALIVNLSRGLGLSILANGNIIRGKDGYAGEFGHMQFGLKNRLCLCGKQNCLGTEVSGYGLELDFEESKAKGRSSLLNIPDNSISYRQILDIALKGDGLAMELILEQGNKLGASLGNIINLLNPQLIVIAGSYSRLGNIFIDSMKIGMSKTALVNPLKNCKIVNSHVESDKAVVLGAASLLYRKYDLI